VIRGHSARTSYLQVLTAQLGANLTTQETLDIHCGQGQQILRWLAYAACAMLSHKRGWKQLEAEIIAIDSLFMCYIDADSACCRNEPTQ
jgi:hypothetical protein